MHLRVVDAALACVFISTVLYVEGRTTDVSGDDERSSDSNRDARAKKNASRQRLFGPKAEVFPILSRSKSSHRRQEMPFLERSRSPSQVSKEGHRADEGALGFSPLHPLLGAEVPGVNLADVGREEILTILAPALEKYGLLLFRGQDISPQEFFNFIKAFPDVDLDEVSAAKNPFAQGDPSCLPELPGVRALGNAISDPALHRGATPELNETGMEWHTDGCGITLLYAAQVPAGPVKRTRGPELR